MYLLRSTILSETNLATASRFVNQNLDPSFSESIGTSFGTQTLKILQEGFCIQTTFQQLNQLVLHGRLSRLDTPKLKRFLFRNGT